MFANDREYQIWYVNHERERAYRTGSRLARRLRAAREQAQAAEADAVGPAPRPIEL